MDQLLSAFNPYDFFGYILCGGLFLAGTDWAFEGELMSLTTAGTIGVVGLAYIAGHALQSVANLAIEPVLWWSNHPRHRAALILLGAADHRLQLDADVRRRFGDRLEAATGKSPAEVTDGASWQRFEAARAALRAREREAPAELMNTMYGLCRGVTTACVALVLVCVAAGLVVDDAWPRLLVAIPIFAVTALLLGLRARRFGFHFAERVVRDFLALDAAAARSPG